MEEGEESCFVFVSTHCASSGKWLRLTELAIKDKKNTAKARRNAWMTNLRNEFQNKCIIYLQSKNGCMMQSVELFFAVGAH